MRGSVYMALPNPNYTPAFKVTSLVKNKSVFVTAKPDEDQRQPTPKKVRTVK
jgi:hypothetical protein